MLKQTREILRHSLGLRVRSALAFPKSARDAIDAAVRDANAVGPARFRVVIEGGLPARDLRRGPRERAMALFAATRSDPTFHDHGVLVHICLAGRSIEIIAGDAIHRQAPPDLWERAVGTMSTAFREKQRTQGVIEAIGLIARETGPRSGDAAS